MTENQEEKTKFNTDVDWFLQILVSTVNKTSIDIGITLNVGGLIISGQLINIKIYFEGLAQEMALANADEPLKDAFQTMFRKIGSEYKLSSEESENENQPPPKFIHLKNAKMLLANGQKVPTNQGVWWRGRLSEVDGFSLGSLS